MFATKKIEERKRKENEFNSVLQNNVIDVCHSKKCKCCFNMKNCNQYFTSSVTRRTYKVINHNHQLSCSTKNIIYLITCNKCKLQYVGETLQMLKTRMNQHRSEINTSKKTNTHIHNHFKDNSDKLKHNCNLNDLHIQPIEYLDETLKNHYGYLGRTFG